LKTNLKPHTVLGSKVAHGPELLAWPNKQSVSVGTVVRQPAALGIHREKEEKGVVSNNVAAEGDHQRV
jgi:hypothetical protein